MSFVAPRIVRLLGLVLILLLVTAGAYLAGRVSVPDATESYIGRHAWILGEAAERAPKGQVLLVGDSLSERSGIATLCGRQVFNAGVSAATLHDLAPLAVKLKASLQPSAVFIALGTNDARLGTDPAAFAAEYRSLVQAMAPLRVVIVSLPAVGKGADIAPEQVAALNRRLQALPAAKVLPSFAVPTVDGIHPTVEGAALWRERISAGCA